MANIDFQNIGSGGGQNLTIGAATEIPFVNGTADDFSYSSNLAFNGTKLVIGNATAAASLHVKSYSILAANAAFLVQDSVSNDLVRVLDDGKFGLSAGATINYKFQSGAITGSHIGYDNNDTGFFINYGADNRVQISSNSNVAFGGTYGGSSSGGIKIGRSGSNYSYITNNGTSLILNALAGNVGIGTISPTSKLQVVGLDTYTNNADAITAGLTAGAIYIRNGHGLDIVI